MSDVAVEQAKVFGEMKAAIESAFHFALNDGSQAETRAAIAKANELIDEFDIKNVRLLNNFFGEKNVLL